MGLTAGVKVNASESSVEGNCKGGDVNLSEVHIRLEHTTHSRDRPLINEGQLQ